MSVSTSDLSAAVKQFWWYHSIDLGNGVVTPGHFGGNLQPVLPLLAEVDVAGLRCLDVGTMDGKMAFELERRGGSVVATDLVDRDTVRFLQRHFKSSVRYMPGVPIDNLAPLVLAAHPERFDFVLCAGVMYHIYSPLHAIINLRRLTRTGGLLLLESACVPGSGVAMHFNEAGCFYDDPTTFWLPTTACLQYMLQYACFEPLDAVSMPEPGGSCRYAVLARAVKPSAAADPDAWMGGIHHHPPEFLPKFLLPLDLAELEAGPMASAAVKVPRRVGRLDSPVIERWVSRLRRLQRRARLRRERVTKAHGWERLVGPSDNDPR